MPLDLSFPDNLRVPDVEPRIVAAVALVVPSYIVARKLLRRYLVSKYTIVTDLDSIATPRKKGKHAGTAVICGGSFAGLFTARVCADHFERVIVVEPEAWTFTDEAKALPAFSTREVKGDTAVYNTIAHKRSRIYQYTAIHVYQAPLLLFARKAFAGFDAIARSWGFLIAPSAKNVSFSGYAVPEPKRFGTTPQGALFGPRRDLEPLTRKLLSDTCPNVEFLYGTVDGFQLNKNAVEAVTVRLADGSATSLECAIVADCTGVSSLGLKLLSRLLPSLGNIPNLREEYNPNTAYSTLEFPATPKFNEGLRALNIPRLDGRGPLDTDKEAAFFVYNPDPEIDFHFIALIRSNSDHIVFCMGGWDSDLPVTLDEARAFTKEAKFIPDWVFKIFDLLEPVADQAVAVQSRTSACWKIRFENAGKILPRNFVSMGDATMRVNPRFGQGVNKSVIGAVTLDGVLRRIPVNSKSLGPTFFNRLAARTNNIWDSSKHADYGHPSVTPAAGETNQTGWFARWFRSKLLPSLSRNDTAALTLYELTHFLAPPTDIFSPSILASVLREIVWPSPKP
ncbi:hypothetical protein EXIGLDRAFT_755064 [Exidia glandulosa HHB12029]|uniref:FAD/NAD(P)-binding domain-containing protein n=1 Tax=Exidia glandulosa HHB12029 TaxID=1314781 RepID=A0A165CCZ8_EXIGL|nr:hypothetical protein EXIGLDRAFT_755064 [Exidia glandulosa HHB12029]